MIICCVFWKMLCDLLFMMVYLNLFVIKGFDDFNVLLGLCLIIVLGVINGVWGFGFGISLLGVVIWVFILVIEWFFVWIGIIERVILVVEYFELVWLYVVGVEGIYIIIIL